MVEGSRSLAGEARCVNVLVQSLIDDGLFRPGFVLSARACARAVTAIRATRPFGPGLFLSAAEFVRNPQYVGVNPTPGRNLYDTLRSELDFVPRDAALSAAMHELLGPAYQCLNAKIVCGVPEQWIPAWLRERIADVPVNNLGPYVRSEYRDITYFHGIDYHQDIIDWKERATDFLTIYVYLHDVSAAEAPLFVLKGSHAFGATVFPHRLTPLGDGDRFEYESDQGLSRTCEVVRLTGPAGSIAWWHAATLHGTRPSVSDLPRLSLRLLLARDPAVERCGLTRSTNACRAPRP